MKVNIEATSAATPQTVMTALENLFPVPPLVSLEPMLGDGRGALLPMGKKGKTQPVDGGTSFSER